jgi:cell division protein FtsB
MPRRRAPRALWPLLASVVAIAFLVLFVFPTRTYLAQRASINRTQHQLDVLDQQNDALAARVEALNTDAEIERLAREQYNLVRPGEEAYALLPAPQPQAEVPDVWPFTGVQDLIVAK